MLMYGLSYFLVPIGEFYPGRLGFRILLGKSCFDYYCHDFSMHCGSGNRIVIDFCIDYCTGGLDCCTLVGISCVVVSNYCYRYCNY